MDSTSPTHQEIPQKNEWQTIEITKIDEVSEKEPLLAQHQTESQQLQRPQNVPQNSQNPPKKKENFLESLARSISEGFSEAFNDFEGAMKSIAKEIDYLVAEGSSESREKTSSSSSISKSSSNTVSSIESASEKKWRTIFNFLSYESLLCVSACRAIVVGGVIEGTAWISTYHWCFSWEWQGQITKVIIPLVQIERVAIAFASVKDNREVNVLATAPPGQTADVLQLFTSDGCVHQFYAFLAEFQKIVDTTTRAVSMAKATQPPQYVPYNTKK